MLSGIRSIHFVGIGGTAMASTAVAMRDRGFEVTGSDKAGIYPPMSTFLAERQVKISAGFNERNLEPRPDLVVIGNVVSRGNPEAEAVLDGKMRYCSLPELLKEFFLRGKRSLVVTGTHGKTTTTALLAWVFEHNGLNPSYLIGGIPNNFDQGARFNDSAWFIIEGDEYDTAFFDKRSKFVHYLPEVAIINNVEFDHADIFEDLAAIQTSFQRFINLVPRTGLLLANGDDPNLAPLLGNAPCPVTRFGFGEENELRIQNSKFKIQNSEFELPEGRFEIGLVGDFNVRNAAAVAACARHCGLSDAQIQSAFSTFTGIKRRMEVRGVSNGVTVLDDFGHHPTAIRETLRALRCKYPGRRLWAIFEPRTNTTRRKVFQRELIQALELADVVVVAKVAALEQLAPAERLDPEQLMCDLKRQGRLAVYLPTVEEIIAHIATHACAGDVVCVFSNGGFEDIHIRLLDRLEQCGARDSCSARR